MKESRLTSYLFLGTLLIILITPLIYWHSQYFELPESDSADYIASAYRIIDFNSWKDNLSDKLIGVYNIRVWKQTPMAQIILPFLLMTEYDSVLSIKIFCIFMFVFWAIGLFFLLNRRFDPFDSFLGSLSVLSLPLFFDRALVFMPEIVALTFLTWGTLYYCRLMQGENCFKDTALTGIFIGLALLFRPVLVFITLFPLIIYSVLSFYNKYTHFKHYLKWLIILFFLQALPYLFGIFHLSSPDLSQLNINLLGLYFVAIFVFSLLKLKKEIFVVFSFSTILLNLWTLPRFGYFVKFLNTVLFSEFSTRTGGRATGDLETYFWTVTNGLEIWSKIIFVFSLYCLYLLYKRKIHFQVLVFGLITLIPVFLGMISNTSEIRFMVIPFYIIFLLFIFMVYENTFYIKRIIQLVGILVFVNLNLVLFKGYESSLFNFKYFIKENKSGAYQVKYLDIIESKFKYIKLPESKKELLIERGYALCNCYKEYMVHYDTFKYLFTDFPHQNQIFGKWEFNIAAFENKKAIRQFSFTDFKKMHQYLDGTLTKSEYLDDAFSKHAFIIIGPEEAMGKSNPWDIHFNSLASSFLKNLHEIKKEYYLEKIKLEHLGNKYTFYLIAPHNHLLKNYL